MKFACFILIAFVSATLALEMSFLPTIIRDPLGVDDDLPVVPELDLAKYAGVWYDISHLPDPIEAECYCTHANYTLNPDNTLTSDETCNFGSPTSRTVTSKSALDAEDPINGTVTTGRLINKMFTVITAPYYVIFLDDAYTYSVVGNPKRSNLYILAREPTMDDDLYNELLEKSTALNFNVEKLIKAYQGDQCTYTKNDMFPFRL